MDAYGDYVRRVIDQRLTELRREAANERLARSLSPRTAARRGSAWSGLRARIERRRARRTATGPVPWPVRLPQRSTPMDATEDLRRTA